MRRLIAMGCAAALLLMAGCGAPATTTTESVLDTTSTIQEETTLTTTEATTIEETTTVATTTIEVTTTEEPTTTTTELPTTTTEETTTEAIVKVFQENDSAREDEIGNLSWKFSSEWPRALDDLADPKNFYYYIYDERTHGLIHVNVSEEFRSSSVSDDDWEGFAEGLIESLTDGKLTTMTEAGDDETDARRLTYTGKIDNDSFTYSFDTFVLFTDNRFVSFTLGDAFQIEKESQDAFNELLSSIEISIPEVTSWWSGMYKVGVDFPAGEYVMESDEAYWELTKDSSGEFDSILANDNFRNRSYLVVKDGEYISLTSGTIYKMESAPSVPETGDLPEGMYKVGKDIVPGEYKLRADDETFGGYMELRSDARQIGIDGIITNDNFKGEKYITLKEGQYIKLSYASLLRP